MFNSLFQTGRSRPGVVLWLAEIYAPGAGAVGVTIGVGGAESAADVGVS
jgi:hypothetical protein